MRLRRRLGSLRPAAPAHAFAALAEDELAVIRAALDESGFAALRPSYLPVVEGADLPSYWITHCGKEVYVDGFAIEEGRVPKRVLRVVERLNDLVEPRVEKALMR
jgi:hypothetical protein